MVRALLWSWKPTRLKRSLASFYTRKPQTERPKPSLQDRLKLRLCHSALGYPQALLLLDFFFSPVSLRKEWLYPGDVCELLWYKIAASSQFFRALHWYKKPHKDDHADEMRRGKPWHLKGVCNNDLPPPPLASQQVKLASFPSSDFLLTQTPRACFREPQT